MGITVAWLDQDKTTILREFDGIWTWDDFYETQKAVVEMLQSVEYKVHQVLDFSKSKTLPPNTLTHMRNSGRNMPENRGKSIVVTQSRFYLQMYRLLSSLAPAVTQRVVIVSTREEALKQLEMVKV